MRESKEALRQKAEILEGQYNRALESGRLISGQYGRFQNNLATVYPELFIRYVYSYGQDARFTGYNFDKFARDIEKVATEIREQEKLTETYTRVYGLPTDEEI